MEIETEMLFPANETERSLGISLCLSFCNYAAKRWKHHKTTECNCSTVPYIATSRPTSYTLGMLSGLIVAR